MNQHRSIIVIILMALLIAAAALAGCAGTAEQKNSGVPVTNAVPQGTEALVPVSPVPINTGMGITITQTDGKQVTLPSLPKRIIVTNSDAAEMLIALGAADTIVGITESTRNVTYLMDKIPQVQSIGDWQTPNVERMLALRPDVVISYASSKPKNLNQILAANITIVYLDCYRLPKLAQDARAAGILTGHTGKAEEYARVVENTTALVMRRASALSRDQLPTVYFEGYSDLTAAGTGSGSDELLTMAGGKNIVAALSSSSAPKVSAEWIVAQDPAYVMKVISAKESRPYSEIAAHLKKRTGWNTMAAVRNDRIYLFGSGIEYGPKAYIGLAATAKILHPDLFADINPREMLDSYAASYVSGANGTTMLYP